MAIKGISGFKKGLPYLGGLPDTTDAAKGKAYGNLIAIDVTTGAIKWRYRDSRPMMGGTLSTAGGVVVTGFIIFVGTLLPERFPSFIFGLAQFLALRFYAQTAQGDDYRHHLDSGGLRGSNWGVVGAILAAVVFLMVVIVVLVFGLGFEL
jgi:hypothetical protein